MNAMSGFPGGYGPTKPGVADSRTGNGKIGGTGPVDKSSWNPGGAGKRCSSNPVRPGTIDDSAWVVLPAMPRLRVRASRSFEPERLHGVELRSLVRWVEAEGHADEAAEPDRDDNNRWAK